MMLEETRMFCKQIIESAEISLSEAGDYSFDVILNDLKKLDSSHKRKNFIEAQKLFIKSSLVAIGQNNSFHSTKSNNTECFFETKCSTNILQIRSRG